MKKLSILLLAIFYIGIANVNAQSTEINNTKSLLKRKVAIARFSNETQYAKGAFYSKENDPTSKQAC